VEDIYHIIYLSSICSQPTQINLIWNTLSSAMPYPPSARTQPATFVA
jgi:hypothetical protein